MTQPSHTCHDTTLLTAGQLIQISTQILTIEMKMMMFGCFKQFSLILRLLDIDFISLTLRKGCLDFSHFFSPMIVYAPIPPPPGVTVAEILTMYLLMTPLPSHRI